MCPEGAPHALTIATVLVILHGGVGFVSPFQGLEGVPVTQSVPGTPSPGLPCVAPLGPRLPYAKLALLRRVRPTLAPHHTFYLNIVSLMHYLGHARVGNIHAEMIIARAPGVAAHGLTRDLSFFVMS